MIITTAGNNMSPIPGCDSKLLIPAIFITADTSGSVQTAARTIPNAEPITAVIQKRRENASLNLSLVKPIAL